MQVPRRHHAPTSARARACQRGQPAGTASSRQLQCAEEAHPVTARHARGSSCDVLCYYCVNNTPHHVQRGDRRPPRGSSSRSKGSRAGGRARPSVPKRARARVRPAPPLSHRRTSDPRHCDRDIGSEAFPRVARHRRRSLGRDCAVGARRPPERQLRPLGGVRVHDRAADEHVARPGDVGQPRPDEPAGTRLGSRERRPRSRSSSRRAPPYRPRVARRRTARRRRRAAARSPRRGRRPSSTKRSTWSSKSRAQIVTSTPSPSPPALASDRAIADRRPRRSATRAAPAAVRGRARVGAGRFEHARPEQLQLARRPGSATATQVPVSRTTAGRRPDESHPLRAVGQRPLLVAPSAKSPYGRFSRAAMRRDSSWIASSSATRRGRRRPRRGRAARSSDRRVSARGRPRRRAGRARAPPSSAPSRSPGSSPTTVIRAGRARAEERRGEERPVSVVPVAANELRARCDDRRAGGTPTGGRDDDHARPHAGHVNPLAAHVDAQVLGESIVTQSRLPRIATCVALLHRPVVLDRR